MYYIVRFPVIPFLDIIILIVACHVSSMCEFLVEFNTAVALIKQPLWSTGEIQ